MTLETFDSANKTTTDPTKIIRYVYSITYLSIRPTSYTLLPQTSNSGVVATTAQINSPGLDGFYSFMVNNQPLNVIDDSTKLASTTIRVSNPLWRLAAALKAYYPNSEIMITTRRVIQLPNQLDFNILYHGVNNPQTITIDTTGVTGGVNNIIDVAITDRRPYAGDRPYFYGIPNDFLRSAEDKPSIEIKYNQIPALC